MKTIKLQKISILTSLLLILSTHVNPVFADNGTYYTPPPAPYQAPQGYGNSTYPQAPHYGNNQRGNLLPFGGNNRSFSNPWNNRGSGFNAPWNNSGSGFNAPWNNSGSGFNAPWNNSGWGNGNRNPFGPRNPDQWMNPNKNDMSNNWDDMMNAPSRMGRMPGGWEAPSISTPNPVDVGDEFNDAARDVPDQMRNFRGNNYR